jgi:cyclophilin family peptidyl-prolyl cis-trans isomerase
MKQFQKILFTNLLLLFLFPVFSQQQKETIVVIETTKGVIKLKLYDGTALHKANFIKLVSQGYYNGLLFHRVIKDFMIQTGDPDSRNAKAGKLLGSGGPVNTIPAEIYGDYYHKKGALAAARTGDNVNPKRESSGSQFYFVQGKKYTSEQLSALENSGKHLPFTDEQKLAYTTIGGTPHLDYAYTVFGEVTEGLAVIDAIASVSTDEHNRPIEDIKIVKAYLQK